MASCVLRTLQDDSAAIAKLAQTVFGADSNLTHSAYLEWKYFKNPFGGMAVVHEVDDKIVGFGGLMILPIKIDKLVALGAIGSDAMVYSEYRRRGVFMAMLNHAYKQPDFNIAIVYGTQSARSPTILGVTKYLQNINIGDIIVLKKYLRPTQALRHMWTYPTLTRTSLAKYLGNIAELIILQMVANFRSLNNALHGDGHLRGQRIEIREITPLVFGDEFDGLWERSKESFRVGVVRIKQYLNWRYANPLASYIGLRADAEGQLCGYCILSYTRKGRQKIAWIVDLLAENSACCPTSPRGDAKKESRMGHT